MTKRPRPTVDVALIGLMCAVLSLCAWITLPFALPFTLQTLGVFLSLELLGGRKGTLAIAVYLLLGAVGLPLFSGFTGGLGHLAGPTGGYLVGFLVAGLVYLFLEKRMNRHLLLRLSRLLLCLLSCYLLGTLWFVQVYRVGLWTALISCVLPYLLPDIAKAVLAVVVADRLKRLRLTQR